MTDTTCPCCGAPVQPHTFKVDLTVNCMIFNGQVVRLAPIEAEVLYCLYDAYPTPLARERIYVRVWPQSEHDNMGNLLSQYLNKLRKKLTHLGIQIDSRYGIGPRLVLPPATHKQENAA